MTVERGAFARKALLVAVALVVAVAAWLVPAATGAAIIDQVYTGCISNLTSLPTGCASGLGISSTVTLTGVTASAAFVVCSTRTTSTIPNVALASCQLAQSGSDTVLTIAFSSAPAANTTAVQYYVAVFEAGVSVQRGSASFTTGLTPTAAPSITAVDCTKSFVQTSVRSASASSAADEQWTVRAILGTEASPCTSGTTTSLELTRNEAGSTITVEWQVVTYEGASVQRGTQCIGAATGTPACPTAPGATNNVNNRITLSTSVDTSKSLIRVSARGGTGIGGNEGWYLVRAEFLSTGASVTGVQFVRAAAPGNPQTNKQVEIAWEVVQLDDGSLVQGSGASPTALAATVASVNTAAIVTVDPTRTVPFFTVSGGTSNTAHFDDASLRAVVNADAAGVATDNSDLTFTRAGTAIANSIAWFAVSFFRCSTASGIAHDPLCTVAASTSASTGTFAVTTDWSSPYSVIVVRRQTSPNDGTPANGTTYCTGACTQTLGSGTVVYPADGSPSASVVTFTDSGLGSGTYYYKVWATIPALVGNCASTPCYVGGAEVSVTTRSDQSSVAVAGGAALNPVVAGVDSSTVALGTNGGKVLVLTNSTTDAGLGLSVSPVNTVAAVQGYVSTFPRSDVAADAMVVADQSGYVYSFNPVTGVANWSVKLDANGVKAALTVWVRNYALADPPSNMRTVYNDGTYDIIFVATANSTTQVDQSGDNGFTNNKVVALRADTGAVLWEFHPKRQTHAVCSGCAMDQIEGQPYLDYLREFLYVASHYGQTGSQNSLWILDVGASISAPTLRYVASGADYNTAPTLNWAQDKLYIGDVGGNLHILSDLGGATTHITQVVHSGVEVKGFVYEDFFNLGHLYWIRKDGIVVAYDEPGSTIRWTDTTAMRVGNPSCGAVGTNTLNQLLLGDTHVWVSACDGQIHQYTLDGTRDRQFLVGDGSKIVGPVSTSGSYPIAELFVTTGDAIYKVRLSGESLP